MRIGKPLTACFLVGYPRVRGKRFTPLFGPIKPLERGIVVGTRDRIEKAHAAKEAKRAERLANTVELEDGSILGPDSPPGRGWVLKIPSVTPRYFAERDGALDYWERQAALLATVAAERRELRRKKSPA
jgi:hypothetical protein